MQKVRSCVNDACPLSLSERAVAVFVFLACARTLRLVTDSHDHVFGSSADLKKITIFHGSGAFALKQEIQTLSKRSMNCRNSYNAFLQDIKQCIKS